MELNALSPYIRLAIRSVLEAPFRINRRILYDYELIYLEAGRWKLTHCGREYLCETGALLLLCPGEPHVIESVDGVSVSQPHIHFDLFYDSLSRDVPVSFKDFPAMAPGERAMIRENIFLSRHKQEQRERSPILRVSDKEKLLSLFWEALEAFEGRKSFYPLVCKEKLLGILALIFAETPPSFQEEEPRPQQAGQLVREYLDANCRNPLTLEGLARQFHYSPAYLEKLFQRACGVPLMRYYRGLRAEEAKRLLRAGKSVTETAEALGFSSIYGFSRSFKGVTGLSPTAYLEQVMEKQTKNP